MHHLRRTRPHVARLIEPLERRLLLSTTWTVTSTADDGTAATLRYAVAHSSAGDTIQFSPTAFFPGSLHTITLTGGQLELAHSLSIQGPGPLTLSVGGNGASRIFQIDPAVSASISGMTLTQGNAGSNGGGAVYNNSGTLSLSNLLVSANTARLGGGVCTLQGTTTATNSTFSNNTASSYGGGFDCDSGTTATVTACTFNNNTAPVGGGILDYGISLNVINSTLTADTASNGQGGGISNYQGTLTVTNCTIDANAASQGGGGIYSGAGSVTLNNSIVAQDTLTNSSTPADVSGTVGGSYNLVGDGSGGLSAANHNLLGSTSKPMPPALSLLSSSGGPTQTMLPQPGSIVVNAGSNALAAGVGGSALVVDQRGMPRVAGSSVDLGSAELQPALVTPYVLDRISRPDLNSAGSSPAALVVDSDGNLYGVTSEGGAFDYGTVFEIAKGTNVITTLANFDDVDGALPNSLAIDSAGNLFGTAQAGGANGEGCVFELPKGTHAIVDVASSRARQARW